MLADLQAELDAKQVEHTARREAAMEAEATFDPAQRRTQAVSLWRRSYDPDAAGPRGRQRPVAYENRVLTAVERNPPAQALGL